MFIDQFHVGHPCTRVQYSEGAGQGANCPKSSVLGTVKAWTPLLDEPLEGKVYFRSNGGARELPDVVLSLNGQFHIEQVGFVDSKHERLRTRFATVPDAPLSRVVIKLLRRQARPAGKQRQPLRLKAEGAGQPRRAERAHEPGQHGDPDPELQEEEGQEAQAPRPPLTPQLADEPGAPASYSALATSGLS